MKNNEINENNIEEFLYKFDQFVKLSEGLKKGSNKLISLSNTLRIPGKYVHRQEQFTNELIKIIKNEADKLKNDKHKFFEYLGSDILNIDKELLMIIPLTNCVFSYHKSTFKKIQVNFDYNKLKLKTFLPGSSTCHIKKSFFITGGEIKDEGTRFFLEMDIKEKVLKELPEMNYSKRFHSNIAISERYICVVGGWKSNEVEIIDTSQPSDSWKILSRMHYSRSDPTPFLQNGRYLYVFGGWCFSNKECVSEIERLDIFDTTNDLVKYNTLWEMVSIKNNKFLIAKYNMGIIPIIASRNEESHIERILLVGGFDEEYDYSNSIVIVDIINKTGNVVVNKEINSCMKEQSSFWYDKQFHIICNENDDDTIAVNFNCFNNIYAYSFKRNEMRLYQNHSQIF